MLKQEQFTTLERKIERFSQLLEQRPDDGLTVLALAEASFRRGLKLEALTAYQVVTRKKPVPEAHLAVAEIYSQQNMTTEAYGELRQLFELDPENVEARLLAQQLSKQAPPPDDIAYILSQPTTDKAFKEARLRFQIQRTIHNRELQERTRNVTLEPGVVIHEYYVEEAKKKLIDVDESLRALEALKEANSSLVSTPRPEPVSAQEAEGVEEGTPAADVVGEVGELTSPTLDPPELTTEAPEVEAEPISAQAHEEVETVQVEEQLSEAVGQSPVDELQNPLDAEEGQTEPVAEELQEPQVLEPQVVEQPELPSAPASESEEAGSEATLSPEAVESVDAVPEESSAPAETSLELEAETPQAQEQEQDLTQEQAPAQPEQFAQEMGAVPEPVGPGPSPDSLEEPEAATVPTSPEPAEPVLEFDSQEQNEFELAPPELPEESSDEIAIGLEPIQQVPEPVENSEEVRTIQLGESPEEFSPPSLEELPEQSEVQQVEQEAVALTQPEVQEQVEEQSPSFSTDFSLSVESPLDPELPDEESDMKPIEMIGEEIPMPTMQVGPTSYAEGSDPFEGEGPSIEIDMSGSEAPSAAEESPEATQQNPEDFSPEPTLAPPPAAEPEPEIAPEPAFTSEPVSESESAAVPEPVVQPESEAIPEPLATSEPEVQLAPTPVEPAEQIEEPEPIDPPDAVASNAARQEFYISKAEELGKLTSTLARTRGVTSIFLVSRDGMTIDSEAKDAISEQRIGELVRESFDFLLAYADSPNYWVLECSGGIFVMQTLDERHVLIAIGQAGANFGALRYTMDKTRSKFGAILEQAPS